MIIISVMLLFIMLGFILMYLPEILPLFALMQFEWIGAILIAMSGVIAIIRLGSTKTLQLWEQKPLGKELIIFLRRDGTCEPLFANRPFHSESFLEAPKIGLIHDLGKGSVYRWGKQNIRFVLENVNHTPDPRFMNFTKWLYDTGFNNSKEVVETIHELHPEMANRLPDVMVDPVDSSVEDLVDKVINDDGEPKNFKRSWYVKKEN